MSKERGQIQVGSRVFVGPNNNDDVYDVCEVGSIDLAKGTAEVLSGSISRGWVPLSQCFATNPKHMSDLCGLHNIHEAGILANLEGRIGEAEPLPYTYLNTVLVAVNPLKVLTNQPHFNEYVDGSFDPERPHPYAIAELAYQNLRMPRESEPGSQSIVISGESGAGKTETAKIVLSYLSNRSSGEDGVVAVGNAQVAQCILDSTPIFEEFGNAKTLRNNNSSRFGKFISLQFSPDLSYTLVGAFVTTYLLEKTRVCYQMTGEKNYHIFYDLLSGKSGSDSDLFLEPSPLDYFYLNQSLEKGQPPEMGEKAMFDHVCEAMGVIGIKQEDQNDMWKILSGILHLGNTKMIEVDTVEGLKAAIEDMRSAGLAAHILGVETEKLTDLLTVKRTNVRGQEIVIKLQQAEASFRRDAVSKALYAGLFAWLVDMANAHLGYKKGAPLPFIGVLDIFGFESFKVNGLEQILINFANEYLQNVFNKQVFEAEMQLFKEENILCSLDDYPDNKPCVDMLSAKGGVLDNLNTQCAAIQPSEDKFVRDLTKDHKGNPFFPPVHQKHARDSFRILHFAGPVQYTVSGWLLKNSDPLPESMPSVFSQGSLQLATTIFKAEIEAAESAKAKAEAGAGGGGGGKSKKLVATTVSRAFVTSMKMLTEELGTTKCNFIRCIKPNPQMRAGVYNRAYVVDQLRCLGILATCEVLKAGMPTRVTYKELQSALKGLPKDTLALFEGQPEEVLIAASMWAFEVPADAYQLGRTRVFFKAGEISRVEAILKSTLGGPEGEEINDRMRLALERRQKALEAVQGVELLMARAAPGVEAATSVLEEVEDASRQVARDFASGAEELSKSQALVTRGSKELNEASSNLDKLKRNPRLTSLLSSSADEEAVAAVNEALRKSEECLESATTLSGAISANHDLVALRQEYTSLRDEAKELSTDTRAIVGDITSAHKRVQVYHLEATDGAKRCLLDYTLERTTSAESECEALLQLVAEISEGGAASAKAAECERRNDQLRQTVKHTQVEVQGKCKESSALLSEMSDQLKTIMSCLRKAESKAAAEQQQLQRQLQQQSAEGAMQDEEEAANAAMAMSGGHASMGSRRFSTGGSGGGVVGVSAELAATIEELSAKVKMMETHHGEQLRALVAKTKDLNRVVKEQQAQLLKLGAQPVKIENFTPPPPPPSAASMTATSTAKSEDDAPEGGESSTKAPDEITGTRGGDQGDSETSPDVGTLEQEQSEVTAEAYEEVEDEDAFEGEVAAGSTDQDDKSILEGVDEKTTGDDDMSVEPQGNVLGSESHPSGGDREADLSDIVEKQSEKLQEMAEEGKAMEARVLSLEATLKSLTEKLLKQQEDNAASTLTVSAQQGRSERFNEERKVKMENAQQPTTKSSLATSASAASKQRLANTAAKRASNSSPEAATAAAAAEPSNNSGGGSQAWSSRLSMWANIRGRVFGGGISKSRMLNLTILEATFHDTSRNQKLPLDAFIEIRNITTGQVEKTTTVQNNYRPKYNQHFVFQTERNANDMIMMKIMEDGSTSGRGPAIFGSVALPLDSKHTQGSVIPMPIFDEGLNMKGVVRVAACWSASFPRKLTIALKGVQDLPEDFLEVACRVSTKHGVSVQSNPCTLALGHADLSSEVLSEIELQDEKDQPVLELLVRGHSGELISFGHADTPLPEERNNPEDPVVITGIEDTQSRARVYLDSAWVESSS